MHLESGSFAERRAQPTHRSGGARLVALALTLALALSLTTGDAWSATSDSALARASFRDCPQCPTMVRVPAGRFTMGAPESESQNRRFGWGGPPIEVRIRRPFAMARTEITRGQFAAFVADTGYAPDGRCRSIWEKRLPEGARPDWRDPLWPDGSGTSDEHPVVCIGHTDAEAYAAWLTRKAEGRRRYGLPSEAQWEYAARAGTRTARYWDGVANPLGAAGEVCRHANVGDRRYGALFPEFPTFDCDDGFAFTSPVGQFAPNRFGLYDLLGNVWEWVSDCVTADLSNHPRDGRAVDVAIPGADCSKRAMRGAGFPSADFYLRATTRGGDPVPRTRLVVIGFRVVSDR
jgi:formylglycine-generating enzyme